MKSIIFIVCLDQELISMLASCSNTLTSNTKDRPSQFRANVTGFKILLITSHSLGVLYHYQILTITGTRCSAVIENYCITEKIKSLKSFYQQFPSSLVAVEFHLKAIFSMIHKKCRAPLSDVRFKPDFTCNSFWEI